MSEQKLTLGDVFESLTGAEDDEIMEQFGLPITELSRQNVAKSTRALIFITKRREGIPDIDAVQYAMGLPMKDVGTFFKDDDDESLGKDDSPESPPASSPSSASRPAEPRPSTSSSLVSSGTSS